MRGRQGRRRIDRAGGGMVRWKKGTGKEQGYAEDPADQCGGDSGDAFYHAVLPPARWDVGVSQDGGFVFVLLGLLELRRTGTSVYGELVVAGLTLGMLGDLLLALRYLGQKLHHFFFAAGSVSFFLGHGVYIAAILTLCPQAWTYAIPIAVVALGAASFYAYAKEVRAGKVTPLGAVYIASVLFMTACAATGAFISSSRALFLFFVGGVCFSASDNMLVVLSFGKDDSPYRNAVLHVLYYMAQIFIALTIEFA